MTRYSVAGALSPCTENVAIGIMSLWSHAACRRRFLQLQLTRPAKSYLQLLGVASVKFHDFSAPSLDVTPGYLVSDAIRDILSEVQPDIVYLPHHGDIHGDHRATNLATLVAALPNGAVCVPRLLLYEILSESEWGNPNASDAFQPTVFVNISEHLADKLKAMACYESQLKDSTNAMSLEAIRELAIYRGHTVNHPAAKSFILVREIIA